MTRGYMQLQSKVSPGLPMFCTFATWKNGEIVEERLFYDVVGFMKQFGLSK